MRLFPLAALFSLAFGAAAQAAPLVPPIPFKERTLTNGLTVITSVDRTTPNVTVQVWYGVGAKNDPPGRSGFAHLFEHMMFKATRDMPAEFMDRITEDIGGMNNAFTSDDNTTFYEVIPAANLERLIWAEAERMSSLQVDDANFHSEREVVKEELRQRVLADPYGRFFRYLIPEASFAVHPYQRSAIGSIEDLDASTLADVQAFHATYYRPANAALVVAGNFDEAQLAAWVERYFGPIQDPAQATPQVTAVEPPRAGPRTVTGYAPNVPLPAVAITWLGPSAASPDAVALEALDAILTGGKSSRLYDRMVYDKQIAAQVFSEADLRSQLGMFYVGAVAAEGHTPEELEAALRAEVAALRDAPPSAQELEIAKTQLITAEVRQRETIEGRASELGQSQIVEGSAARANTDIDDLAKVTPADVQRVAQKYLPDALRVVVRYLPDSAKPAGAPESPDIAPPQAVTPLPASVARPIPASLPASPPPLGPQPPAVLPTPQSRMLANGLEVIVAKSADLPLIAATLTFKTGAEGDPPKLAGVANLTAALVTEGTTTRTARDIARQSEALGANLSAVSGWEVSQVSISVTPEKLDPALAIMADVAEHPAFAPDETERARKEALDGLDVAYDQPEEVARFATAPVVYGGTPFAHAAEGTRVSLKAITRDDLAAFHHAYWRPDNAILVLTGDITPEQGFALAERAFGAWPRPPEPLVPPPAIAPSAAPRAVAIDLPGTGQAAVVVTKPAIPRADPRYYQGLVANDVLGGGYSARLNEEVRVKRGLSYGAGSSLTARRNLGAFTAQAQTRNEAAAQVADLIKGEVGKLATAPASAAELAARKASLIGENGRSLATAGGLGGALATLALYGIDLDEIKAYQAKVEAVTPEQIQAFARDVLDPAQTSIIVVGDGKLFLPTLETQAPHLEVVPIGQFDPDSASLRTVPTAP
jgi:zinc protease